MAHLDEDEDPLEELIAMGFEEAQASAALAAAGGDLQAAVDWCFEQEDGQLPAPAQPEPEPQPQPQEHVLKSAPPRGSLSELSCCPHFWTTTCMLTAVSIHRSIHPFPYPPTNPPTHPHPPLQTSRVP